MHRIRIDVWVDGDNVRVRAEDLKTFRVVEEETRIYSGNGSEGYDIKCCIERSISSWLPEDHVE